MSKIQVTLSERDLENADRLRRTLHVSDRNAAVHSSLDVFASLAEMVGTPGSKLYLKKSDGSVREVFIKPRRRSA